MDSLRISTLVRRLLAGRAKTLEIASMASVSARTIARDIATLTDAGVPIYTEPGRGGGLVLPVAHDEEREELLELLDKLDDGAHTNSDVIRALAKHYRERTDKNAISYESHEIALRTIQDAIVDRNDVHMHYCAPNGRVRRGFFSPRRLLFRNDEWHFEASPAGGGPSQMYRVSRLYDVKPAASETTELPLLPEKTACRRVRFLFPMSMGIKLQDSFPDSCLTECDSGDVEVAASTIEDAWNIGFLMAFGTPMQIDGPRYLHAAAEREAREIYRRYTPPIQRGAVLLS